MYWATWFGTTIALAALMPFSVHCVTPTSCKSLSAGPTNAYERPLDFVYANNGSKNFGPPEPDFFSLWNQVTPGLTSLVPFLLNEPHPSAYDTFINQILSKKIAIIPAIGDDPVTGHAINSDLFKNISQAYCNYTDYIRLENMQGYYDFKNSSTEIQDMINYLTSIGFKHIMLNPWPRPYDNKSTVVPFTNPQVEATIFQVELDYNNVTNQVNHASDSTTNWRPNPSKIAAMQSFNKTVKILINYEVPPEQLVLANLENSPAKNSTAAMNLTLHAIDAMAGLPIYWAAPWRVQYNPVSLGTWGFEVSRLNKQ